MMRMPQTDAVDADAVDMLDLDDAMDAATTPLTQRLPMQTGTKTSSKAVTMMTMPAPPTRSQTTSTAVMLPLKSVAASETADDNTPEAAAAAPKQRNAAGYSKAHRQQSLTAPRMPMMRVLQP